jgi:hypothetical protein
MMVSALLLSLLLVLAPEGEARAPRLPPVDDCAADSSFVEFRDRLTAAIERRDRDAILALISDDIHVDFGGGAGRDDFARTWELERPDSSQLWDELSQALRLGCAREPVGGGYYAPAMFLTGDDLFDDPFTAAVVIRDSAVLRAAPDPAAELVATLAWDVVTVPEWDFDAPWQRIQLADGRSGYVRTEDIRSPVDYRAAFQRVDGRWRMTAFIAGD